MNSPRKIALVTGAGQNTGRGIALRLAKEGVTGAYLCYPVRPGYIQATAYFADAARRAGVEVVVEMSQISARETL